MNKSTTTISSFLLALLLVVATACYAANESNSVEPETPAPLAETGKTFTYNFDAEQVGRMSAKFHAALTGKGAQGAWAVVADSTAVSAPNVVAQTSTDKTNNRFPLLICDEAAFRDVELSVKFKPVSGRVDQAAGLVWRLRDSNNYLIVRANALENNVVLYKVVNGKRTDLPVKGEGRTYGKKAPVPANKWSELRVSMAGNLAEVFLNGTKLFEVEDETFKDAGKIGLWTKADSVTHFDDLRATAK